MNENLYNKAKQAVIDYEQSEQEKEIKRQEERQGKAVEHLENYLLTLEIVVSLNKNEFIIGPYRIFSDPDYYYHIFIEPIDHSYTPKRIGNWSSIGFYINEVEKYNETSVESVQIEPEELSKYALVYWPHLNTEKRPFTIHGVANDGPDPYACIEYTDV